MSWAVLRLVLVDSEAGVAPYTAGFSERTGRGRAGEGTGEGHRRRAGHGRACGFGRVERRGPGLPPALQRPPSTGCQQFPLVDKYE